MSYHITQRDAASAVAIAASLYFSFSQVRRGRLRQQHDLELGSSVLADALREMTEPLLIEAGSDQLSALAERFGRRGRLAGIAVYDSQGGLVAATRSLALVLGARPRAVADCLNLGAETADYEVLGGQHMRVNAVPLRGKSKMVGALGVFHDTEFIEARRTRTRWKNASEMAIEVALFLAVILALKFFFK